MRKITKRYTSVLIVNVVFALMLACGCEPAKDEHLIWLNSKEARETFERADTVKMFGDADLVDLESDVRVGDKVAGHLRESGFWDIRVTYMVNDENQFYLKYVTGEPINQVDGYETRTTYGYYDMNDQCFGYAQERMMGDYEDHHDDLVFLDAEGNMKDYYITGNAKFPQDWTQEGASVMSLDGEKVGEIYLVMDNYYNNEYSITLNLGPAADSLSAADKSAIYWRCAYLMNQRYYEPNTD